MLSIVLLPSPASAWGFAAHRCIMRRAIDILPAEIKPFFVAASRRSRHRASSIRIIWRNVGWDEDPNHFVNFGAPELGPFPFTAIPREHGAALEKFGAAALKRLGTLPWREDERVRQPPACLRGVQAGQPVAGQATPSCLPRSSSHYVQDAHQPFHASNNYDGQLTGQRGIHSRFERDLVERFEARLTSRRPRRAPSPRLATPRSTRCSPATS